MDKLVNFFREEIYLSIFCLIRLGAVILTIIIASCYEAYKAKRDKRLFTRENIIFFEHDVRSFIRSHDIMNFLKDDTLNKLCQVLNITIDYHDGKNNMTVHTDDGYKMFIQQAPYRRTQFMIGVELGKIIRGFDFLESFTMTTAPDEERIRKYYAAAIILPMDDLAYELKRERFFQCNKKEKRYFIQNYADKNNVDRRMVEKRIIEYITVFGHDYSYLR